MGRATTLRPAVWICLAIVAADAVPTMSPLAISPAFARLPEAIIREVRVRGNQSIDADKILAKVRSRAGRPLDQATLDNDIRALNATKWFSNARAKLEKSAGSNQYDVIVFEVEEMPVLKKVEFRGRKQIKLKEIEELTGLKVGARADFQTGQLAKEQIQRLYREKGFDLAEVRLISGDKPGQQEIIIEIYEGPPTRISQIEFHGNEFVTGAVLKTKMTSKEALVDFGDRYFFQGRFYRDVVEEDARKLREYYQSMGFLEVQVSISTRPGDDLGRRILTFDISEGPRYRVREIVFEGNSRLDPKLLAADIKLKGGEPYSDALRDADQKALTSKYAERGFLFAQVVPEPRYTNRRGVIDLVYKIEEGDAYRLGDLIIRGNAITKDEVIRREAMMAGIRPGEILDRNRIEAFKTRLAGTGYFVVTPDLGKPIDVRLINRRSADQPYTDVAPSASALISPSTRMQGPDNPPIPAIRNPGAAPNEEALEAVPFGAGGGGLFRSPNEPLPELPAPMAPEPDAPLPPAELIPDPGIRPAPGLREFDGGPAPVPFSRPPSPPGTIPPVSPENELGQIGPDKQDPYPNQARSYADLVTELEEGSTGRFMLGGGLSSFGGVYGSLIYHESNFDLFNIPRSWSDVRQLRAFRGGGQELRVELSPGTLINRAVVSYRHPYLFFLDVGGDSIPIASSISAYTFKRFYPDFNENRAGGRYSIGAQFGPATYAEVAVRAEDVNFTDFRYPAPADYLASAGHTFLATLRPSVRYDTRNNPMAPSEGSFLELAFEQGWGDFTFSKFTAEGRKYFTVYSRPDGLGKHTFTTRGFFGITGRDTPVYERFFAGDFRSLRGFAYRGVGPYELGSNVGGILTALGSVEYQFPITARENLHGVVFCDFGTVESDYSITTVRAAVGAGIRVVIPQLFKQVPLAFDVAFPISKADGDRERNLLFFLGAAW